MCTSEATIVATTIPVKRRSLNTGFSLTKGYLSRRQLWNYSWVTEGLLQGTSQGLPGQDPGNCEVKVLSVSSRYLMK